MCGSSRPTTTPNQTFVAAVVAKKKQAHGPWGPIFQHYHVYHCGSVDDQYLSPWWEKVGNLARSLQGNLTIWREIFTFEIKKYIKYSGKSDYLAVKNTLFQVVPITIPTLCCRSQHNRNRIEFCSFRLTHLLYSQYTA